MPDRVTTFVRTAQGTGCAIEVVEGCSVELRKKPYGWSMSVTPLRKIELYESVSDRLDETLNRRFEVAMAFVGAAAHVVGIPWDAVAKMTRYENETIGLQWRIEL